MTSLRVGQSLCSGFGMCPHSDGGHPEPSWLSEGASSHCGSYEGMSICEKSYAGWKACALLWAAWLRDVALLRPEDGNRDA